MSVLVSKPVRLLAALAVGLTAVLIIASVALGQEEPADGGVLHLHIDSDADYFALDEDRNGESEETNPITSVRGCTVQVDDDPVSDTSLVSVTPDGDKQPQLGLADDGLGVKVKGEGNGTKCGFADGPDQTLLITLEAEGKLMNGFDLDIEGKFETTVLADLRLFGEDVATLRLVFDDVDSGPDAGIRDNKRMKYPTMGTETELVSGSDDALFNEVLLYTGGSAISLMGGADWRAENGDSADSNDNDTVFQLIDATGIINCRDPEFSITATGDPDATIFRGDNDKDTECSRIPFVLESTTFGTGSQLVTFEFPAGQNPTFLTDVVWNPEAGTSSSVTRPFFDDDGDGVKDPSEETVPWCEVVVSGVESGNVFPAAIPGGHEACLVSQSTEVHSSSSPGSPMIQTTDSFYVLLDPGFGHF